MTIVNGQVADADEVLSGYGNPLAQLAYEQVKSDSTEWTNTDYLGADIFTDVDGEKDTVDTGNTTAEYDITRELYRLTYTDDYSGDTTHDPDSFTNPENPFDGDDGTFAQQTTVTDADKVLGKTFSAKNVGPVKVKAYFYGDTGGTVTIYIKLQSYNGSIWSDEETLSTTTAVDPVTSCDDTYYLNKNVQGIRILFESGGGVNQGTDKKLYTLEYGYYDTPKIVETDSIISDIVPDSIVVYGKATIPTDTSITVDVSDDGGTSFTSTGNSLNTPIDTSSFSTGNIALKFNLATTDTSVSPFLYGYGVTITDI